MIRDLQTNKTQMSATETLCSAWYEVGEEDIRNVRQDTRTYVCEIALNRNHFTE